MFDGYRALVNVDLCDGDGGICVGELVYNWRNTAAWSTPAIAVDDGHQLELVRECRNEYYHVEIIPTPAL